MAGLEIRPRSPGQVEDQIDLVPASTVPLLVTEGFDGVEVGARRLVEEHIDPTEFIHRKVDKSGALVGIAETTRLERHHLATTGVGHLDGLCSRIDSHITADD